MAKQSDRFLSSAENLALDLIFSDLGESRINRSMAEYAAIASRAPKLSAMHHGINETLRRVAEANLVPYQICDFQAGDQSHWYKPFPTELSLETVRKAWVKSGMRALQLEHRRQQTRCK